jgi:tetratricopeptide (TPR) repeat protein
VTSSLVALRSFLAGEEELTQGRFTEAVQAYRSAVDADSTFAIAYLNLGRAANWAGDYPMADYAIGRALKFIDRLNPIDQLCVRARQAYQLGEPQEAERLLKLALINDVGVAEAWFDLGEIHFHWGGILGHPQAEARNAYEQALAIYGNDVGSLVHLTRIAAAEGRVDRVDSLARKATSRHLDEPQALELRGLRAFAKGDRAEIDRVQAAINRLDETAAYSVSTMLAVFAAEFPAVGGVPAGLRGDRRSARYQVIGTLLSAELAMAHGHSADASRILAPSSLFGAARSIEYRAALASLPFRTIKPSEALTLRKELMELHEGALIGAGPEHYASPSIYPARRAYLLGMLSLKGADTAAALQEADQLERGVENEYDRKYRVEVARLIRSEIARSRGDAARALELLGHPSVLPGKVLPGVLHYPSAHERFLRAELARSLGRTDEALRWYGTFPDPSAYDLMYLAAVHAGAGSAYEQRRDVANARASYERALALFAEGDAEWAPFVNAVRARLAAVR